MEEKFVYQDFINSSATQLEKHLNQDLERNLFLLLNWLKKDNPRFKPRKFKRELLDEINSCFSESVVDVKENLDNILNKLKDEAFQKDAFHNYLIITLYIYRYLIWYMYEYGFQPSFTWELYRSLRLTERFYRIFEKFVEDAELKSQKMSELAKKRHEASRMRDRVTEVKIAEIWHGNNWDSYTQCANHVHKNNLVNEENYRKIYTLISKVAKQRN